MAYSYGGKDTIQAEAAVAEALVLAKFEYFRTAEASIDAGPGPVGWRPAPIRKREATPQCGTHSGYKAHITSHANPCKECREARALYQREYRANRKAAA